MERTKLTVVPVLLIALAGCAGTEKATVDTEAEAPVGNNRPTASASAASPEPSPTPEDDPSSPTAFGRGFTYADGVSVQVAVPKPFTVGPDDMAVGNDNWPAMVRFEVTVINKSGKAYDPSSFYATIQSGNTEGEQVFASNLPAPPSTSVLPGREVTWSMAFGVSNPKDLVLEVQPSFEHEAAIFTNAT